MAVQLPLPLIDALSHIAVALRREAATRRGFLFIPVLFGLGITLYFSAPTEPHAPTVFLAVLVFAVLTLVLRQRAAFVPMLMVCCILAGFATATWRAQSLQTPMIERPIVAQLTGHVLETEQLRRENGTISRLLVRAADDNGRAMTVRVSARTQLDVEAGASIRFRARLMPPSSPALPGGYDFEREAYFSGLTAVGSIVDAPEATQMAQPVSVSDQFAMAIDRGRERMAARIQSLVPGDAGALCAALVTGKRGLISQAGNDALRASGLYHIVSISGLHMAMLTGLVFAFFRRSLALFPWVAYHMPLKAIAAGIALLIASAYCLFSGADVATVRSWIMVSVMLGAVIIGRPALSMRNVALSALLILAFTPEVLLGPSFQMSFSAVACLIAAYEVYQARPRNTDVPLPMGPLLRLARKLVLAAFGLCATTVVASLATGPFAIEHFQRLSAFGLFGNLMAVPLVSFVVMPAALLGSIAMPFGYDSLVWNLMGLASGQVLQVAHQVAGWPDAIVPVPAAPWPFFLFSVALLWFCLFGTWLRSLAVVPAILGLVALLNVVPPLGIIASDGRSAAFRMDDRLTILGAKPSDFVLDQWAAAMGIAKQESYETAPCDALACAGQFAVQDQEDRVNVLTIALVRRMEAFAEDCQRADLIISPLAAPVWCKPRLGVQATQTLVQSGAVALALEADQLVATSSRAGMTRLWQARQIPVPAQ